MRLRPGAALTTAVTMGFGMLTLAGLLADDRLEFLQRLSDTFLQLVVITVSITILIGLLNLVQVHVRQVGHGRRGWGYSIVLLSSMALVIALVVLERTETITRDPGERDLSVILLESVEVAVESALAGLLLFALVYGAARMMRRRVTWWGLVFTAVLIVLLVAAFPDDDLSDLVDARDWLLEVPVSAGTRGILLGIALGTIVTGVRVLTGQDRSYRE